MDGAQRATDEPARRLPGDGGTTAAARTRAGGPGDPARPWTRRDGAEGRLRLRGWGGVAAMAAACAVTAAFTLIPLTHGGDDGGAGTGDRPATGVVRAQAAADEDCVPPSLPPSGKDGPTIEKIEKRGQLVVGIDQSSYRWGYLDPNKVDAGDPGSFDPEGFDIDLVHAIAQQILGPDAKVVYRAIPTNERIPALQDGKVDMVVRTMTMNCERAKDVAFSAPYFKTGQQVLAPESTDVTGFDDSLKGKRVCAATGSIALEALEKESHGAEAVNTVANQLDCLVQLQLGQADAVVTDGALAAGQAAQDPAVKLVGKPFTTEYYGVAMSKKAPDLVKRVNYILEDYRKSGWQKAYDTWLKKDLGPSDGPPAPTYR